MADKGPDDWQLSSVDVRVYVYVDVCFYVNTCFVYKHVCFYIYILCFVSKATRKML